jgi:hypothetical protein
MLIIIQIFEDIMVLKVDASRNRASKYLKQNVNK